MKSLEIHKNAEEELLNVLRSVIFYGENNSCLIMGPRGSGKTYMIKNVLLNIRNELKEKECENDFLLVNLSGCFQTDDKEALIEISKQLQLENVINEKIVGSFADNFEFLIKSFRSGDKQSKPLIFIMDEFDLFTKNKSQLLLYTLLNTIQTSTSPMCLIGVTCRIDILDLLEKRIKSRFSHRQIYLFNDYDFSTYLEMTKFFLENNQISPFSNCEENKNKRSKYIKDYLNELLNDNKIIKLLNRQFDYDKSITTLKRLLVLPSLKLSHQDKETLKAKDATEIKNEFYRSFDLLNIDTKSALLIGLSILELTLIVVMLELSETFIEQPFNFDLIYNAYLKFCQKRNWNQQKNYEKQIVVKAYEHLIALNFILPATDHNTGQTRGSKISKEHTLMYLALDKEEIENCLEKYPNCPTELKYHQRVY